jgi:hypothetical protein
MPTTAFTALALAASTALGTGASAPGGALATGLPPVREALTFSPGTKELRLVDLLDALAKSTGLEITADPQTRAQLVATVEPLESLAPVPAGEVYRFVETILVQNGIAFARVTGGERPVLTVRSDQSRAQCLAPVMLPVEQIGSATEHPALLVRTLLTLENVDTRQVTTQLRQLYAGGSASLCVPVGDRGLILQDTAPDVAAMVEMLRAIDAATPARPTAPAGAAEPASGVR